MTEDEIRHIQTMEGQLAALSVALIRIARACPDPEMLAADLDAASNRANGEFARQEGCTLMLRLLANEIRRTDPKPGDWVQAVIRGGKDGQ